MNAGVIDKYLEELGKFVFFKTQNRTLVARLNKGCKVTYILYDCYFEYSISQALVFQKANKFIFIDCSGGYLLLILLSARKILNIKLISLLFWKMEIKYGSIYLNIRE